MIGLRVVAFVTRRMEPAVRGYVQRLRTPRESVLDLHPSTAAPPGLRWRQHVRDLLIELGFAPDPGEWVFCEDPQGHWIWEYIVSRSVVARSSSYFGDFTQCLRDAREHGFSSAFGLYSTRCEAPDAGS